jgi:predicted GIY-YIG superfamily endonuclease
MILYENGVIYKLCCNDTNITDIYIGVTTNFRQRKNTHKYDSKSELKKHLRVYDFINKNGRFSNWSMIEIEKYKASDKQDLLKRERYWIEQMKPTLNSCFSFSTLEQKKMVREKYNNSDKKKEQSKNYRKSDACKQTLENRKVKVTCDCGDILSKGCLSKHLKRNVHKINMSNLNNNNNNNNI